MAGDTDGTVVRLPVNTKVEHGVGPQGHPLAGLRRRLQGRPAGTPRWCRTGRRSGRSSADTLNAIVADCSSDPKAALDKLAETFAAELTKQGVKA